MGFMVIGKSKPIGLRTSKDVDKNESGPCQVAVKASAVFYALPL